MQLQIIELRQDRNLIKPNFDGYRLSLDPVPIIKQQLPAAPLRIKPSEEQFSYLHVELFSLQNHLFEDPWLTGVSYFVDETGNILKCAYDENSGRPHLPISVYKVPDISSHGTGDYNYSFRFISEKFGVFCDGCNMIYLLDTGDRHKNDEWKNTFITSISEDKRGFIIRDCRLDIMNEEKYINIILQHINYEEESFFSELYTSTMKQSLDDKTWSYELIDILIGKGSVNYVALEPRSKSVILASNKEFHLNSKNDIETVIENKNESEEVIQSTTVSNNLQPVSNLDAQIEECDYPTNSTGEEHFIVRFDLESKFITHKVILGSNPPIFSTCLRPGQPHAIAIRQDVDACIWGQKITSRNSSSVWDLRHEGSLHAFAYVQASKVQKKFIDCSPDMSYAVISESFRHVFIYKTNYYTENALRNRNGPQIPLGKQHLVTLEDVGEVLGMTVDNNVTTLLTEKCILFLQING